MNSYIAKFACTPYLAPPPPNPNIKTTNLRIEDTLLTLFEGFEHSLINDRQEKLRMFQELEINLPKICNLQADRFPNDVEPNKMNGTIMTFLTLLADPSYRLTSLCPIPKLDTLKLDFLLKHCLTRRIPIERAVWAIHHYIIKMEIPADTITNTLISIQPTDIIFYCKLCNGIYRKNLLNHITFLKWAITHIPPEYLKDFEKDIVRTHSLLYYSLSSNNVNGNSNFQIFLKFLSKSLLINESHIIQLSLLCENQKIFTLNQAKCIYSLIYNKNLLKRIRHIHEILFSKEYRRDCSSFLLFLMPLIIFKDFPHYNFEVILNNTRSASFFLKPSKQTKIALNICQTVINRFTDPVNVSSLAAWLIRKLGFKLDVGTFCEWVFELTETTFSDKYNRSDKFIFNSLKVLFYELQFQGVLNYKEFHSYVHSQGYFVTRPIATKKIISEFPILLYDLVDRHGNKKRTIRSENLKGANEVFPKVLLDLHLFFPDSQIEKKMKTINSNPIGQLEMIKTLPFCIRFVIASWTIISNDTNKKRLDSKSLIDFLNDLGTPFLIPELSRNSSFVPRNARQFLAAFESHGLRNNLETVITNEISPSRLSELFIRFSHLCSLHVFDLSFSIRSHDEVCLILSLFFCDLMTFKNISYKSFVEFFDDFCYSMDVPNPVDLFVSLFLSSCYLKNRYVDESDRISIHSILNGIDNDQNVQNFSNVYSFISLFVRDLFKRQIIKPSEFAIIVLTVAQNKDNRPFVVYDDDSISTLIESVFQILLDFLAENASVFESNDCLTLDVVDMFMSTLSFYSGNQVIKETLETVYHNFLTQLKILRPPQFSSKPSSQSFLCAVYTLLPAELFSDDCGSIINFFKKNANRVNLFFWCSWLRDRTEFKPGFPVAQHEPFPESKKLKYITELVDTFWNQGTTSSHSQTNSNTYDFFNDSFEKELCEECWWILCESKSISNAVIQKCINKSFFNFSCLHPALLTADELILEYLCDKLRETNTMSINDDFVLSASSVFVIFVSKFAHNYKYFQLTVSIANKLLEWMLKLWEDESSMLMTLIDTFNFIVCWSLGHSNEEEAQSENKGFANQGSFHDMLHSKIIPNMKKLPKELERKILLNKPKQAFKIIKNPLYLDFVSQDNEPGNQLNEGGSNFHGDFSFFDDDVEDQLFWG